MAVSYPRAPLFAPTPAGRAARLVWRLALAQLPAGVTVHASVALHRRRPVAAGLVPPATHDLVIVDPDVGITVVTVSGARSDHDLATAHATSPHERARATAAEVRRILSTAGGALADLPVRWAVAAPDVDLSPRSDDVPPEAIWDRGAAVGDAALVNAYHALWSLQPPRTSADASTARPAERLPRATTVDRAHQLFVERTVHGAARPAPPPDPLGAPPARGVPSGVLRAVASVAAARCSAVVGGPGSGKTTVALELAATAAARGERVLLTCANPHLGGWLRTRLTELLVADGLLQAAVRVTEDPRGQVVVGAVHDLTGARPAVDEDAASFYATHAADWVAATRLGGTFDTVLVDEWQDVAPALRVPLHALRRDGGRFHGFVDPLLAASPAGLGLQDFPARHDLDGAPRLPAPVARLAGELAPDLVPFDDDGDEAPPVTWTPTDAVTPGTLEAVVADLVASEGVAPHDVVVLTLSDRGDDEPVGARVRDRGLLRTSSRRFAGLARPAVVLALDVHAVPTAVGADELRRRALLACTRATQRLVVVGDPDRLAERGLGRLAARLGAGAGASLVTRP